MIEAQEEERKKIARRVHDGPAQALANVVLQSEISERLFSVDPERSRKELAALRETVNKTLQELRGFIFELRPMILDDLGLVPTLRRYVQTLKELHATAKIELASTGRDRRLPAEDEIAVFRLIQDGLSERLQRANATQVALTLEWSDDSLVTTLESDGRELPVDSDAPSGVRRSERVALLRGRAEQTVRADGKVVLQVTVPVRPSPALIS
ncbi:MAG: hypothetical protein HYX56_06010 [Chloroflexi bacterium]|nr:hypothetical protein [Chloroflexota bacterium]